MLKSMLAEGRLDGMTVPDERHSPRAPGRSIEGGFTLVELLAVLAVIGMLVAILIPAAGKSMRHAASTVCRHHLREVYQALHTYRLDHQGWLPDVDDSSQGITDPHGAAWFGRLIPRYLTDMSVLICPSDPIAPADGPRGFLDGHPDPANASSYGLNDVIRAASLGNLDRSIPRRPIETLLIADMGPDWGTTSAVGPKAKKRGGGRLAWDDGYDYASAGLRDSWLTDRHFGHINVLTIGGNVKAVRTRELMEEKIRDYYGEGAAGGCPLCLDYSLVHYSFAASRVFWWTGRIPVKGIDR